MANRVLPWAVNKKEPKVSRPRGPTGPRYEGLEWKGPIEDSAREVRLKGSHLGYTFLELKDIVRKLGLRGFSKYTDTRSLYSELKKWLVDQEKYFIITNDKPLRLPGKCDLMGNICYKGYSEMARPATSEEIEERVRGVEFQDPVAEEKALEDEKRATQPRLTFAERAKQRHKVMPLLNPRKWENMKRRKPVKVGGGGWIDTKDTTRKTASPALVADSDSDESLGVPKVRSPIDPSFLGIPSTKAAWAVSQTLEAPVPEPRGRPSSLGPSRSPSPEPRGRSPSLGPSRSPSPEQRHRSRSPSLGPSRSPSPEQRHRSRSPRHARKRGRSPSHTRHGRDKRHKKRSLSRSVSPSTPRMRRPGKESVTLDAFTIELIRHELGRVHGSEKKRLRSLKALIKEHVIK